MRIKKLVQGVDSILAPSCIKQGVDCQSKKRALEVVSGLASERINVSQKTLFESILARERMGSTGIGKGVAIPHARFSGGYLQTVGVFISLNEPIAFDSLDNKPVDLLFCLLVPAQQHDSHNMLSVIAKYMADDNKCHRLRSAQSDEELHALLKKIDDLY